MQNKPMWKTLKFSDFILYFSLFLASAGILFGFRVFYAAGFGKILPNILFPQQILLCGISAPAFFAFLSCSPGMKPLSLSKTQRILCSFAYSFSAYALLQETAFDTLFLFVAFPLLFLSFEIVVQNGNSRNSLFFLGLLTVCLLVNTPLTATLALFLLLALFADNTQNTKILSRRFIHTVMLSLLALLISGISSVPSLFAYYEDAAERFYYGFDLTYPLSNFCSRFFMGSLTSSLFPWARGINLYFGMFFLLFVFLYFFNQTIALRQRVKNLLFLFILLCSLETSPMQYLFELFAVTDRQTVPYAFLLVFWCIKAAAAGLAQFKKMDKKHLAGGLSAFVLFSAFAFAGSCHNFHSVSLSSCFLFMGLYVLCVLCLYFLPDTGLVKLLLPCFIVLELFCNIFITTNQNFIPKDFLLEDRFIWNRSEEGSDGVSSDTPPYMDEYNAFADEYIDTQLVNTLNLLFDNVEFSEDGSSPDYDYELLNVIERANALCSKIGAEEPLFSPIEAEFDYPASDSYRITYQKNHMYNLFQNDYTTDYLTTVVPFRMTAHNQEPGTLVILEDFNDMLYSVPATEDDISFDGYLAFPASFTVSINFQLRGYYLNEAVYNEIPDLLVDYIDANSSVSLLPDYIGMGFTCIGILLFLLLYANKDRKKLYERLDSAGETLLSLPLWKKLYGFWRKNRIYCCAFLIPVALYLLTMIVFSCIPFGTHSFYDGDGLCSTLPTILDHYYNLKDGNLIFSMNGGYGYCIYNDFPLGTLEFILLPLSTYQVAVLVLLVEGLCLGFCSFTVVYYLTHRLTGQRALKSDFRLLIPALLYALNTYMLAMHGFVVWYYTFLLFPLLMLAMDYLMYRKKWMMYTIVLSLCIILNIQLALYACIFLVILFFTYHFDSFKDFVAKGLRFALFSILAALNGCFSIACTLFATSDSMYQESDSVFPALGFHTSYLEQWKQLMVFSDSRAVNDNDGGICIYMSILLLFLALVYFFSRKFSMKEKIRRLIPLLFLVISFNGKVSSFIWNGFHYQSNVPNRHVFIFAFLCTVIAYDGLRALKSVSLKKYFLYLLVLGAFFCLCQFLSEGNTLMAFISTLVLLAVYWMLHLLYRRGCIRHIPYHKLLVTVLLLELSANMFFTTSNYGLNNMTLVGPYEELEAFINGHLKPSESNSRIIFPSSLPLNLGRMYNAPSSGYFSSYATGHQIYLNTYYGFCSGVNYTITNYNSTPLGLALSGTKYCFFPVYSVDALPDLDNYNYLGCMNSHYIYEVPDTLSLGFYAPEEALMLQENAEYIPDFWNRFTALYTPEDSASLFTAQLLTYCDSTELTENSYNFSGSHYESLTPEEADVVIDEAETTSTSKVIRNLLINMKITPNKSGYAYLYVSEFVPLGYLDQTADITISYPNPSPVDDESYFLFTFNDEVFHAFMEECSKNQMEEILIDDNHITGVTNYDKDGYTILSLAYDNNWTAYVDGKETEVLDPYGTFMAIETPAGKHTIELVYTPYGMKTSLLITFFSFVLTFVIYGIDRKKKLFKF